MKICRICNKLKSEADFNKKLSTKDGLQTMCQQCSREYSRRHYDSNKTMYLERNRRSREEKRLLMAELKADMKCHICGEKESCCLDFHHCNPNEKNFSLSEAICIYNFSWDKILEEAAKCIVLCANCHRKVHAGVINCPVM